LAPKAKSVKCFLLTINLKQKIMLAHVYISRPGDREKIVETYEHFLTLSDEELREKCIAAKKQGLFGVHAQALNFIGLWNAARKRNIPFDLTIDSDGLMEFKED